MITEGFSALKCTFFYHCEDDDDDDDDDNDADADDENVHSARGGLYRRFSETCMS